jgi:uncharacterized protein (UPF0332 family)
MLKKPPIAEVDFLRASQNHRELDRKLKEMGIGNADLLLYAQFVARAWFRLGEDHLQEARAIVAAGCIRATYSRAYYAAYNASKGVRYFTQGQVSLKGDDHSKAGTDLPTDFTELSKWSATISALYENRLRADYDNWYGTTAEFSTTPSEAVLSASNFIMAAKSYLSRAHHLKL